MYSAVIVQNKRSDENGKDMRFKQHDSRLFGFKSKPTHFLTSQCLVKASLRENLRFQEISWRYTATCEQLGRTVFDKRYKRMASPPSVSACAVSNHDFDSEVAKNQLFCSIIAILTSTYKALITLITLMWPILSPLNRIRAKPGILWTIGRRATTCH